MKTYDTGKFKWQHMQENDPQRGYDGRSLHHLLGPCPRCGNCTEEYGGGFQCLDRYCYNNANNFACSNDGIPDWWNTNINVKLDGDMWCAFKDDFINLQESDAGFGKTPREAVESLRKLV